jgi:metallophosphoesterase superfamily enzyme
MQAEDEIFLKEKSKKYCLIHGHKSPSPEALKSDFLIMGHVHPAVSFRDRLGMRTVKKIWIRGKFEKGIKERYPGANPNLKFIIMPAFNEFITGSSINETDLAGPLLKKEIFKITHAQLFLLNGVELDLKTLIRE